MTPPDDLLADLTETVRRLEAGETIVELAAAARARRETVDPAEVAALIKKCALSELGARLATAEFGVLRGGTDRRAVIQAAIAVVSKWRT